MSPLPTAVIVGKGQRLYEAPDPATFKLELAVTKAFGKGSVLRTTLRADQDLQNSIAFAPLAALAGEK